MPRGKGGRSSSSSSVSPEDSGEDASLSTSSESEDCCCATPRASLEGKAQSCTGRGAWSGGRPWGSRGFRFSFVDTPFLSQTEAAREESVLLNYLALGQVELARATLRMLARRDARRALSLTTALVYFGPPPSWLCSASAPSSAHLVWFLVDELRAVWKRAARGSACDDGASSGGLPLARRMDGLAGRRSRVEGLRLFPPWLLRRLHLDVLLSQAVLDAASLGQTPLSVSVISELRLLHAVLLGADSYEQQAGDSQDEAADWNCCPALVTLPGISLLPLPPSLPPSQARIPPASVCRASSLRLYNDGHPLLSREALREVFILMRSQPALGDVLCAALGAFPRSALLSGARGNCDCACLSGSPSFSQVPTPLDSKTAQNGESASATQRRSTEAAAHAYNDRFEFECRAVFQESLWGLCGGGLGRRVGVSVGLQSEA